MDTPSSSNQPPLFGHNLPSADLVEQKNNATMILNNQEAADITTKNDSNNIIKNTTTKSPLPLESPEITAQQALAVGKAHGLQPFDVICGKCSLAFNNVGNRRFRVVIGMNVQRYIDAPTRSAKSQVIRSVVKIFQEDIGASFVKQDFNGKFVPVSDKIVRQKVGHALRDHAAFHLGIGMQSRSSSPARQQKRINRRGDGQRSGTSTCSNASSSDDSISEKSSSSAPVKGVATSTTTTKPIVPFSNDIVAALGGATTTRTSNNTRTSLMMDDIAWADDLSIGSIDHQPLLVRPSFELFPEGSMMEQYSSSDILPPRPPVSISLPPQHLPFPGSANQDGDSMMMGSNRRIEVDTAMDNDMIMDEDLL
jgi:hypothetical protein